MTLKEFLKTTEAIVVLGGLALSLFAGKFWIIATAIAYTLLNVPSLITWIRNKINL